MGKGEELTTTKYLIHAEINANGIVEKPDVVGAVFGQTEGLLSNDLDLRELQRTGRIGRIQVIIHSNGGRAKGEIVIPSSLDRIETAILAASLETINRVGPCEASIHVLKVEDVRAVKRQQVVERAKEIYMGMMETVSPESMKMIEEIRESMRVHEISEFGEERLPAGPNVHTSDAIIVVEGRSDVLNLLKYGIKNTVAVEGVNIPQSVADLTKKRTVTAFVDGDRGGELILKELLQVGDVDYITRAPRGKEVEDLEKEEVMIALRDKAPLEQVINNLDFNLDTQAKPKNRDKGDRSDRSDKKYKLNKSDKFHGNKNGKAGRRDRNSHKHDRSRNGKRFDKKQESRAKMLKGMLRNLEGTGNSEILDDSLNLLKEVSVENLYDELKQENPDANIIKMGIGDVTKPLVPAVVDAFKDAVDEMGNADTFMGYGPEQGYDFLAEAIIENDYKKYGVDLDVSEIFISDGAKCDTGNIQEIFGLENKIAVTDPVYTVYVDTNVMAGRTGEMGDDGMYEGLTYLKCNAENGFVPELPSEPVDIIYLCYPNNPTGTTLTKDQLKVFIDYAKENNAIILFDSAYEAFINDDNVPHTIYEIEGAREVVIEFKSFSKTAGFTGTRCAYTVVPKELMAYDSNNNAVEVNPLWNRRQTTKFNGVSYPVQKAAEATYSKEGKAQIREVIEYYMNNAKVIRESLTDMGLEVYGGVSSPYIWVKTPNNMDSWDFFDVLLNEANVIGTPGSGFGPSGEGYLRLTAFNTLENTKEAMDRISKLEF